MNQQRIGLFHLPKTGGSFLINYFKENIEEANYINFAHHKYFEVKDKAKDTFNVIFVRNPLAFYVSQYFYFAKDIHRTEAGISKGCDAGLYGNEFIERFPTVESHIRWGFDNLDNFSISQLFNQMAYYRGKMVIDYVATNETMHNDIEKVFFKLKIPFPAISINQYYQKVKNDDIKTNKTHHETVSNFYSHSLVKLVKEKDKEIFLKYYPILF